MPQNSIHEIAHKKALAAAERPGRGIAKRSLEQELQTQLQNAWIVCLRDVQEVGARQARPTAVPGAGSAAQCVGLRTWGVRSAVSGKREPLSVVEYVEGFRTEL